jgi:hypothetical protein
MGPILELEAKLGRRFASIMWFMDWSQPFPAAAAENAAMAGAVPNITWEPWIWGDEGRISLADINAGDWDAYISEWGAAAARFGKPLLVRWGHEFNGDWYPWSVARNGEDPNAYIQAYRRVHRLVTEAGASNVIWVWCPNAGSVPAQDWNDPLAAYPGAEYVDWIALDGYDFDTNASFEDIFSKIYSMVLKEFDKPIYIGEFATGRTGADKAAWLKAMHESLTTSFAGIKGIVYFNVLKEREWRLDDSPASLAGAREVLSLPFYKSSPEAIEGLAGIYAKGFEAYRKAASSAVASSRALAQARRASFDASGSLDWSGAKALKIEGKGGLGGEVRVAWDEERLYLRLDAIDAYPMTNSQRNDGIWNGDCLEVCVSTEPGADPARLSFTKTDWQLGFAPSDPKAGLPERSWEWSKLRSAVPGAAVSSKATDAGYVLEAAFPWSALSGFEPRAGMVLGFDVAVDDGGADGKRSFQWIWNGNSQFYNSPAQWGELALLP